MTHIVYDATFYILAFFVVGSAGIVALSRNIMRSAFAMVVTFLGVAGLFVLLSADFLAATQLLVYVGGILVLILFAVMLSSRMKEIKISNLSVSVFSGGIIITLLILLLTYISIKTPWKELDTVNFAPTTSAIGNNLLTKYLLPFEVLSVLLLVGLIGAVVIARKEKDEP
jgi:NADH-quinone oxidoreductase subunit J